MLDIEKVPEIPSREEFESCMQNSQTVYCVSVYRVAEHPDDKDFVLMESPEGMGMMLLRGKFQNEFCPSESMSFPIAMALAAASEHGVSRRTWTGPVKHVMYFDLEDGYVLCNHGISQEPNTYIPSKEDMVAMDWYVVTEKDFIQPSSHTKH